MPISYGEIVNYKVVEQYWFSKAKTLAYINAKKNTCSTVFCFFAISFYATNYVRKKQIVTCVNRTSVNCNTHLDYRLKLTLYILQHVKWRAGRNISYALLKLLQRCQMVLIHLLFEVTSQEEAQENEGVRWAWLKETLNNNYSRKSVYRISRLRIFVHFAYVQRHVRIKHSVIEATTGCPKCRLICPVEAPGIGPYSRRTNKSHG